MITLTKRNCMIYLRSPGNVLLSLLGALMVLVVYALFLGDSLAASFSTMNDGGLFVTTWMLAGMCAVAPLSTSLSVAGAIVTDRIQGVDSDFAVTPTARFKIAGGYLASGIVGAFLMTSVVLVASFLWILASGGVLPSLLVIAQCLGVLALACISSACITFFIASLLRKNGTYNAVGTIVGTLGGFLAGIYLPIGQLPTAMQTVVKLFPPSHTASLLRTLLLENMAAESYANLPAGAATEIAEFMGVRFTAGEGLLPLGTSLLVLVVTAVLFFGLSCLSVMRKKK